MFDAEAKVDPPPPTCQPEDLKGHTSLMDEQEVRQKFRG
jgi:hypothetical protein